MESAARRCYLSTLELHELDEACAPFLSAFGEHPYLVGSEECGLTCFLAVVGVNYPIRRCRICDGPLYADDPMWIDFPPLGRFWICETHRKGAMLTRSESGAVLFGCDGLSGWLSLGPYRYGDVRG